MLSKLKVSVESGTDANTRVCVEYTDNFLIRCKRKKRRKLIGNISEGCRKKRTVLRKGECIKVQSCVELEQFLQSVLCVCETLGNTLWFTVTYSML